MYTFFLTAKPLWRQYSNCSHSDPNSGPSAPYAIPFRLWSSTWDRHDQHTLYTSLISFLETLNTFLWAYENKKYINTKKWRAKTSQGVYQGASSLYKKAAQFTSQKKNYKMHNKCCTKEHCPENKRASERRLYPRDRALCIVKDNPIPFLPNPPQSGVAIQNFLAFFNS